MPARGSYQITSREEGKSAQRDESYKSCIMALLIFLLLCIVIILASWPWNKSHANHDRIEELDEDSIESARVHGDAYTTKPNDREIKNEGFTLINDPDIETDEFTTLRNDPENKGEGFTTLKNDLDIKNEGSTTVSEDPEVEIDQEARNSSKNVHFERYSKNSSMESENWTTSDEYQTTRDIVEPNLSETTKLFSALDTTTKINLATAAKTEKSVLENDLQSYTEAGTPHSVMSITEKTTEESTKFNSNSTNLLERIKATTKQIETTRKPGGYTSLQRLLVAKYFGNESTASTIDDSDDNWLDEVQLETTPTPKKWFNSTESMKLRVLLDKADYSTTAINIRNITETTAHPQTKLEITTINSVGTNTSPAFQNMQEQQIKVCETGSCKQLASKMLSYMNHSVDPCDDFYEYACGGLEADRQINEKDLSRRIYETIAIQARKKGEQTEFAQFNTFYESCLKYEMNYEKSQRIQQAKEALNKVGKFYTSVSWPSDFQGFTSLLTNMLMNNGPILFDIVPDINETNPDIFTLMIGPPINKNPFEVTNIRDPCEHEAEEDLQDSVDLHQLYENYKSCKHDTGGFVASIRHALKELSIFEDLENPYNVSQYLDGTTINIDLEIIKGILPSYPSRSEILEAYRSKQYTVTTLDQLEADCKLLNWTQLISSLTGINLGPNAQLQIYYKSQLIAAMQRLYQFSRNHEYELNNALLGLYARNLYHDLVAPRLSTNLEKHCLHIAAHFLQREASQLYMSSFSEEELQKMTTMMQKLFNELKETLKLEIQRAEWTVEWGRQVMIKKLQDMRISLPDISYLKNNDWLNMTDNYFENALTLMKKYRSMIYSVLQKNSSDPEQIWTFFASPYQSITQTIYALNLIVIPFGVIDWPIMSQIEDSFDYIVQATIGNLIAREMAHNFDTNGIRYWNGSRDSEFALMDDSDQTKIAFNDYIECHRDALYQMPMEIPLPATGQRVKFTIPSLTLNERLSDAVGMRLAHDTLVRLDSFASEKRLPWLDLDVSQLFYLAYAQTHCTKAPLTSSYVSLYEDPSLPSRIRMFVVASNNKNLGEAWNCPEGSQILPETTCGVFPHFEYRANYLDTTLS